MTERQVSAAALVVIAAALVPQIFGHGERIASAQYSAAGPVEPLVVAGSAFQIIGTNGTGTDTNRVWRFWSDGRVDTALVRFDGIEGCTPQTICPAEILPGSCSSDNDRNGQVEFPDLLNVLRDWGPCPE